MNNKILVLAVLVISLGSGEVRGQYQTLNSKIRSRIEVLKEEIIEFEALKIRLDAQLQRLENDFKWVKIELEEQLKNNEDLFAALKPNQKEFGKEASDLKQQKGYLKQRLQTAELKKKNVIRLVQKTKESVGLEVTVREQMIKGLQSRLEADISAKGMEK